MKKLYKGVLLGVLVGIMGVIISFFSFSRGIEEDVGLGLLFRIRGIRPPPTDVVIISIDHESSEHLKVPDNPDKWPRSLHARLIDRLVDAGASVVTFDVHFLESRLSDDDRLFAQSIQRAGNVVLAEALSAKELSQSGPGGNQAEASTIVRILKPFEPFARAAIGTGPFVLPRIPFKVNQYWTFQQGAGDVPTFPVIAVQLFSLPIYEKFIHILEQANPRQTGKLPRSADAALKMDGFVNVIEQIRGLFGSDPLLAERMLETLDRSDLRSADPKSYHWLKAIIKLYGGSHSRYINYYGPPRTIRTIPFYQALQQEGSGYESENFRDLKGKAVFVGLSEVLLAERKDSFYTVYSQANGVFIGGVEIAATSFANILEDSSLVPLGLGPHIFLLLIWGLLMGGICRILPTAIAAMTIVGMGILYLGTAAYQFKTACIWYPIFIPLFLQTPFAFGSAVLWNYFETDRERKNMRKAFGYYLPDDVVDALAADLANLKGGSQVVYGTCLFTDASNYTTLSEKLNPKELSDFLGKYFEALFTPVRQQGGLIVDLKGDSILAIWKAPQDQPSLRKQACFAALGIAQSVAQFNRSVAPLGLPTRIGLHAGEFTIGTVGAVDHYEYRPAGDVINTGSRVEGFNKSVGTQIAVSDDVIRGLEGFVTKELGAFRLKGKANPLVIHELVCLLEESEEDHRRASEAFGKGLEAFRRQLWDEARTYFEACRNIEEKEGPADFYIRLCKQCRENPPGEPWDTVVTVEAK